VWVSPVGDRRPGTDHGTGGEPHVVQAYLDAIEDKAGCTPRQLVDQATTRATLWLDGKATEPA
jgi:hypothetical protein